MFGARFSDWFHSGPPFILAAMQLPSCNTNLNFRATRIHDQRAFLPPPAGLAFHIRLAKAGEQTKILALRPVAWRFGQRLRRSRVRKKPEFYGWTLLAVLFSLDFVNMGFPVYGGTVINSYMLRQIPMTRSTLGLGFTFSNLFVGLSATIVAMSILKQGVRKTFAIGSGLICAGSLFLALFASKPWHYLVGYGGIIGVGMGFGTLVPAGTAVTRWFKRYRGRAMGICLGASGIAGFVVAPLLNRMLAASGGNWRVGWQIVAAVAVISGIVALLFVKERPESLGQAVDGIPETEPDRRPPKTNAPAELITTSSWTPAEAYRTKSYWLIAVAGITCQYPLFFFIAHWILHARG